MATKKNLTRGGYTAKTAKAAGQKVQREADYGTAVAVGTIPLMFLPGGSAARGAAIGAVRALTAGSRAASTAAKAAVAGSKVAPKLPRGYKPAPSMALKKQAALKQNIEGAASILRQSQKANRTMLRVGGTGVAAGGMQAIGAATGKKPRGAGAKYEEAKLSNKSARSAISRRSISPTVSSAMAASARSRAATSGTVTSARKASKPPKIDAQPVSGPSGGTSPVGPNLKSKPMPKGKAVGGGGPVRSQAVAKRLALAEEAAKSGNFAAARNYANAALNIQKRGTGGKASQKRVANVAKQYAKLAKGK